LHRDSDLMDGRISLMNIQSCMSYVRSVVYKAQQILPTFIILHSERARRSITIQIVHTATTQTRHEITGTRQNYYSPLYYK
jgi:hypothetical protein